MRAALLLLALATTLLALAPAAGAATPVISNGASARWLESLSAPGESGTASRRRARVTVLVKHDAGRKVTGLRIDDDYDATDETGTTAPVRAVTAEQPAGAFNYSRVTYAFDLANVTFPCSSNPFNLTDSPERRKTLPLRLRARLDDNSETVAVSSNINLTPTTNCLGPDEPAYLFDQTQSATRIDRGQSVTFNFKGDDPDVSGGGVTYQGINWRMRRLSDGATTSTTCVRYGDSDNTERSLTVAFPNRGRWVVEAEVLSDADGTACDRGKLDPGDFFYIGGVDVNTAATSSPDGSIAVPRPSIGQTVTATATLDDADDSGQGGRVQMIEWDADRNATNGPLGDGFERREFAADETAGLTTAQRQQSIATAGLAPGTYTVRARITDNGALNGADTIRRVKTLTQSYLVDTPPQAQAQTLDAESGRPLEITLTGTDANSDPLTYSVTAGPSSGTLTGSGASRTYTPNSTFAGEDSFTFKIDDGFGGTDTATVAITVRPDTAIDSAPSSAEPNPPDGSITFSSAVADVTFECRLDSTDPGAFEPCASPFEYEDLSDGEHTFDVRARTAGGLTDPTPASVTFTVDAVVPETTILSGPPPRTSLRSAEFTFSGSEDNATFECRLDSTDFTPCESATTQRYAELADGQHTFEVRAIDEVGQRDPTPASHTWRVDTRAPETAVISGPATSTSASEAAFDFSADETGSSFECRLDSAEPDDFKPCDSPKSYPDLPEGRHTFDVRATDAVGNTDQSPASYSWTVDRTAPDTTLDGGPAGTVRSRDATFDVASTEAGSTLQCRIDGGAWKRCSSPASFKGLDDGTHTLEASAIDAAGNTDPEPASRTWSVDATAPQTAIDSGPRGTSDTGTATFESSASEAGSTLECRIDGGPWEPCGPSKTYSGLSNGDHTFEVRATDGAGNVDPTPAARTWTVAVPARAPSCSESAGQPGCVQPLPATLAAKIALPRRGTAVDASLSLRSGGADLRAVTFTLPRDVTVAFARGALGKRVGSLALTRADGRRLSSARLSLPKRARKTAVLLKSRGLRVVLRAGRGGGVTVTGLPAQVQGVSLVLSGRRSGLLRVPRRCFSAPVRATFTGIGRPARTVSSNRLGRACARR